MAQKIVLKNLLSNWGIMNVEMQTAIEADQAVVEERKNLLNEKSVIEWVYLNKKFRCEKFWK